MTTPKANPKDNPDPQDNEHPILQLQITNQMKPHDMTPLKTQLTTKRTIQMTTKMRMQMRTQMKT